MRTILAHTGLDHSVVYWNSGLDDEAVINFWLLAFDGGQIGGSAIVRNVTFAGYREYRDTGEYSTPGIDALCQLIDGLDGEVEVITADPLLEEALAEVCPTATARVTRE
jgi:hypothetical protein